MYRIFKKIILVHFMEILNFSCKSVNRQLFVISKLKIDFNVFSCLQEKLCYFAWQIYFHVFLCHLKGK